MDKPKIGDFVHSLDPRDDPELFYEVLDVYSRPTLDGTVVELGLPGFDDPPLLRPAGDLTSAASDLRRLVIEAHSLARGRTEPS